MKDYLKVIPLIALVGSLWGQAQPAQPQSPSCTKNVSFAVAEGGQPVPAIPKFVIKWLDGKSRREHFSGLCFSQIPSSNLTNYIVVFSSSDGAFEGLTPSAHTYSTDSQGKEGANKISSYGGTWSYGYQGVAPPSTTDSLLLRRDDKPKAVSVRAFDQTGRSVAHYTLASVGSREKLLEQLLTDILHDTPAPEARKLVAAALPVYYVNCDVDSPAASMAAPPASKGEAPAAAKADPPSAPPPPQPQLEIWSSPPGADIFLDGGYVGKTPYSLSVSQGAHTIDLRKKDFAIWQTRITALNGKRKIGGNLEQKVLNLQ